MHIIHLPQVRIRTHYMHADRFHGRLFPRPIIHHVTYPLQTLHRISASTSHPLLQPQKHFSNMSTTAPTLTGAPSLYPPSSFPTHISATCLCAAIRVTITDSELFTRTRGHLCHCSNCRKVAGSYVSSNLAIEKEKVVVEDPRGVMKKYRDMQTGSGKCVERCFCGECGK